MEHQIISIERIQREAKEAAQRYSDINDACPYAFHSEAGRVFKEAFLTAQEDKQRGMTA